MSIEKSIATYRRLRAAPVWRLLAADTGPVIIALLQSLLYENDRSLQASLFIERLSREIELLRGRGELLPQTPQAYIASWLADGYLERRYPTGASEESYELSSPTVDAIRFITGLIKPHTAATESRLSLVIQALIKLADDTDTDKYRRLERLEAEKARIQQEIDAIENGQMRVLPHDTALERTREIISLTEALTGDFRRVRDQFDQLNRGLRERLIDGEGSRGDVLDALFSGIDLIGESEAGRTFTAFWRLLTDYEQSAALDEALDGVLSRSFVAQLDLKDRRFLRRMMSELLDQGGSVHEVLQTFARSLRHFVQSREYLEQRRLNQLLNEAQRTGLGLKDTIKATDTLDFVMELTSSQIRSVSQWVLHDPSLQVKPDTMQAGVGSGIDLESIQELVAQSEIDFRQLKSCVRDVLTRKSQASVADVLAEHPAAQGLGSVVGLLSLGSRHGIRSPLFESVSWQGDDLNYRSARIPKVFFVKEKVNEWI